jgi:hypothetical protein
MTLSQAIKKYNLIKQERDCFGCLYNHEVYTREEEKDGIRKICTVEQDELAKEENELVYWLIIERFDYNKIITNKHGFDRPSKRTKIEKLEND